MKKIDWKKISNSIYYHMDYITGILFILFWILYFGFGIYKISNPVHEFDIPHFGHVMFNHNFGLLISTILAILSISLFTTQKRNVIYREKVDEEYKNKHQDDIDKIEKLDKRIEEMLNNKFPKIYKYFKLSLLVNIILIMIFINLIARWS